MPEVLTAMRLSSLIHGLPVTAGAADPEVSGVQHDSRRVAPGDLFVALVGTHHDARTFAGEAAARGAVAVLAGGPPFEDPGLPWLTTPDPRGLLGPLAARIYGHPDRELVVAGVTGTNGKSTVAALLGAILEAAGHPAAVFGTLGYRFRGQRFAGELTTLEASDLHRTLRRARDLGAEGVAMEVSSHALAQERVRGLAFDVAVFTNLSQDHLDFHRDLEDYFATKQRLFRQLKDGGRAVVNLADEHGRRLARELPGAVTFGPGAEVACREVALTPSGLAGVLATPRGELRFTTPLLGRYNLENLLAAAAAAEALALPHAAVAAALAAARPLPGRLEPVDRGQPFPVYIDYAHTPAALAAALTSVREFTGRKLIAVFGCGGDRDRSKREPMGRLAGELAELPLATSDNPRSEDPAAILAAVERGLAASGNRRYRVVPDRREALRQALAEAGPEWAVVVAGKGHEEVQIVGDRRVPFSDRAEVERILEATVGHA